MVHHRLQSFYVVVVREDGATMAMPERSFTEAQRRGIRHMVENAGREPVPPGTQGGGLVGAGEFGGVHLGSVNHAKAVVANPNEGIHQGLREAANGLVAPGNPALSPRTADGGAAMRENRERARQEIARASGYTGDLCSQCGSDRMKRNGSCLCCESCGSTTGCS